MPNQDTTEDVMATSRRIVAALDPALSVWEATIRADERAKVRAELLAIADETDEEGYRRWSPLDARVVRVLADRIAPVPSAAAVAAAILTPDADA